jgi:hypothetical protein
MAKLKPKLRSSETYSGPNFLRLHTRPADGEARSVTIEHMCYGAKDTGASGIWCCKSVVESELMSLEDARLIAQGYAEQLDVPIIYECHEK